MATTTLTLDGNVTQNWDTLVGAATHYEALDEGTGTPNDTDYVETVTLDDVDEFTLSATPANTNQVTQVDLKVRCGITDASDAAYIRCELFHSAGTPVTGNPKDISTTDIGFNDGTLATVTKSWTTLTLTKTQADSLQVRFTFKSA